MSEVEKKSVKVGDMWQSIPSLDIITITAVGKAQVLCLRNDSSFEQMIPIDAALFHIGKLIERDGKPIIPKPEKTLKEKIEEEYPDFEVVMLYWDGGTLDFERKGVWRHVIAQSMEGFEQYVYIDNGNFCLWDAPIYHGDQPVAVLFAREEG